jgi:hypothetical protein
MPMVRRTLIVVCATLLVLSTSTAGAQGRPPQGGGASDCQQALLDRFESLDTNTLDQETIDSILLLREEEKLARDVYLTLSWWYDLPVFPNIARSEQQHMNLVALLLDRYELPDPAEGNGIGEFDDPWVQGLYNDLIAQGAQSLVDALIVGATIEDVDIYHLQHILDHSDYDDVNLIVQNMVAGSRNHMRSFVGALEKRQETYDAQFISQSELEAILASPMETAVIYDENGDVLAECGRGGRETR